MRAKYRHLHFVCCVSVLLALRPSFAEPKEKFPAEVEKPLAELVKQAVVLKAAAEMELMNKAIDDIVTATQAGEDVKKRLETEAKAVVERSLEPWKEKLDARLRPFLRQDVKESLELMTQWPAEMLIRSGFVPDSGNLTEQDDWKNALKKVIAPEQVALLEKQVQERDQAKEKEIQGYLKPLVEKARKSQGLAFKTAANDVKSILQLTGDRAKKVDTLAEESAKRSVAAIEKRFGEQIRSMNEESRAQFSQMQGQMPFNEEGVETSMDMEEWNKALRDSLSPDEQSRWAAAASSRKDRDNKAMAMLFISNIDSVVLFTASQREKMEPLAVKVMSTVTKNERGNYVGNPGFASKFNLDEIKFILDENQVKHWQEVNRDGIVGRRQQAESGDAEKDEKDEKDVNATDSDLDEDTIFATYFQRRDQVQRKRLANGVLVKLEDIQRVVKLPDESIKRLEIASRGAAEHALDFWRPNFENWVRSSMRNVTPKTLKQRLASLNREVSFGEQASTFDQPIWTTAVADVLTAPQMEAWMKEVNERKSYHDRARVLIILAELDRRCHLSLEQMQKLEPLLGEAVTEYAGEFNRMFSGGGAGEMPRYLIVLLAGVPEAKTKSILSPEQFEQWHNAENAQLKSWWEAIKTNHDQRKKMKKK